jgi:phosphatidylglycerophosphate synthase
MVKTKERLKGNMASPKEEGIISTLVVRKISVHMTRLIAKTPITPNQITFIAFFVGVIGAYLIVTAKPVNMVIGGVLFFISFILDNIDGEIARLKKMSSEKGAFIDGVLDRLKEGVVFFAISLALFRQTGNYWAWILGFFAAMSVFMTNIVLNLAGKIKNVSLRSVHGNLPLVRKLKEKGIKQSFFTLGIDIETTIISLGAVLNKLVWVLLFFAIVQNIYWIMICIFVVRRK